MSHVNQLLGQLRQSEENTHQKLMQIAQGESHVAQHRKGYSKYVRKLK